MREKRVARGEEEGGRVEREGKEEGGERREHLPTLIAFPDGL